MPVEKATRSEKGERRVVTGHNREVQNHEARFAAI